VAIVRMSGPDAFAVAAECVSPWPLEPRSATLVTVRSPESGDLLDSALATSFPAPRSFTGEDIVEVSTHGGMTVPSAVLAAFVRAGARPALPGEFTRRAILHGKLDLLQAEALGDLIDAPSGYLRRAAVAQLSGALSRRVASLRDAAIELEALLAYDIDFPGEDEGPIARSRITKSAETVLGELELLLSTLPAARLAREGAVIVLAGIPNAGKSSLFNALLGEMRAIVTEHPGTTRDAIDSVLEADPYPWRLVDTAGLRDTLDPVERLGVEVSHRWLAGADVVLVCGTDPADRDLAAAALAGRTEATLLRVQTMCDREPAQADAHAAVSAITGEGLGELRNAVNAALSTRHPRPPEGLPLVTRARQEAALVEARMEIGDFIRLWESGAVPATIAAVHVRSAIHALDTLIGAVDLDDVLDRIFERFCIGK